MSTQRLDLITVADQIALVCVDATQRDEVTMHPMLVIWQGQRIAQVDYARLPRCQRRLDGLVQLVQRDLIRVDEAGHPGLRGVQLVR